MSKTTNKSQLQMLLNLMEEYRDIACGFQSRPEEEVLQFWEKTEKELNSCGPPIKTIPEWKKVWSDQKKYVRAKAAENLKHQNGTGGGPNKEYKFSDYEQAIYDLVGMKESVEGVAAATFGLGAAVPKRKGNMENIGPPEKVLISSSVDFLEGELTDIEIENLFQEASPSPKTIPQKRSYSRPQGSAQNSTASEAFQKELELQKDLCLTMEDLAEGVKDNLKVQKELCDAFKAVSEEATEIRRHTSKIYHALDIGNKNSQELLNIKKEKLKETKRHNLALEELRKRELEDKIEYNRRALEIEEPKKQCFE